MYIIVKIAGHACIRVQKMALPLMARGHKVSLISQKVPSFVESYDAYSQVFSIHQLRNIIRLHASEADVFHCHNEPSWFVTAVKEVCDKPVILDVHDSFLARSTPEESEKAIIDGIKHLRITTEERNNFQLADGLVFPSKPFAELIINEFKLTQPFLVLPSYLPWNLYNYLATEWYGGLVYEGRIDIQGEATQAKTGFQYTDYTDLSRQCRELGIDFHVYARGDDEFHKVYQDIAVCHDPVPYPSLMKNIAKHDWGLVGNSFWTSEWDVAFPNKLFEYIAAGVPIVAINASECSRFIEEHGIGITVGSIEELVDRWREHTDCRKRLLKIRHLFTMEQHVHEIEELYGRVIDGSGNN